MPSLQRDSLDVRPLGSATVKWWHAVGEPAQSAVGPVVGHELPKLIARVQFPDGAVLRRAPREPQMCSKELNPARGSPRRRAERAEQEPLAPVQFPDGALRGSHVRSNHLVRRPTFAPPRSANSRTAHFAARELRAANVFEGIEVDERQPAQPSAARRAGTSRRGSVPGRRTRGSRFARTTPCADRRSPRCDRRTPDGREAPVDLPLAAVPLAGVPDGGARCSSVASGRVCGGIYTPPPAVSPRSIYLVYVLRRGT
jgi:hypothetical protein